MNEPKAIDIIKQSGKRASETFAPEKLHHSVRAACLSVRSPEGEAETIAHSVTNAVVIWLVTKPEVTSGDVRRIAALHLKKFHPEAAYFYEHHGDII